MSNFHIPVLKEEILSSFSSCDLKIFVDCTLGSGGHAREILQNHKEIEKFIGIDQDEMAIEIAKGNLKDWEEKTKFFHGNFVDFPDFFEEKVDGFLFDLGFSSMQIDSETRGFSFRYDAPLDMRMDMRKELTAEKVINEFPEKKLGEIFKEYGEETRWRKIAQAIVWARRKKRIETTKELLDILKKVCRKRGKIHPATLVFQALRIFVNDELEVLKSSIKMAIDRLNKNGQIAVVSFHSLEDRIVKEIFRENKNDKLELMTKKPITASLTEKRENPRSRSAKLRVARRL